MDFAIHPGGARMKSYLKKNSVESRSEDALWLLCSMIRRLGWRYYLFFGVTISFGAAVLLPPAYFRFFTTHVQTVSDLNVQKFLPQLFIFGFMVASVLFLSAIGNILLQEWLRLTVESDLRKGVLRSLHLTPLTILENAQRGEWLTRMTGDLQRVEDFLSDFIPNQVRMLAVVIGSAALFILYSGVLALIPILVASILAFLNFRVQVKLSPLLKQMRDLHGGVLQMLVESLEGIRTIRSHSVERFVQKQFEGKLKTITVKSFHAARILGLLIGSNELIVQTMVAFSLSVVTLSFSKGSITLESLLFYPFFIGVFFNAAQGLASGSYDWNRFFIEAGRLAQLLKEEPSDGRGSKSAAEIDLNSISVLEVSALEIGYKDKKPLIKNCDFQIGRGSMCAITGPSGCGKSTFLEVLAGLRPALSGSYRLMGSDGVHFIGVISESTLAIPLGLCAYVEQRPYIFEGTLRDNLTFGDDANNADLLWAYLDKVGLKEYATKNGGLSQILQDRGENLSEGERYRLALARALTLKRPFLICDEPFSALDKKSLNLIVELLNDESQHCGVVLVTHYIPQNLRLSRVFNLENLKMISEEKGDLGPRSGAILEGDDNRLFV